MKKNKLLLAVILSIILFVVFIIGIFIGTIFINPFEIFSSQMPKIILWDLRIPRILLAAIVGSMLSVSGAILQGALKNPLSDPYILGISGGGALGAAISIIFGLPFFTAPILAFLFSLCTVCFVFQISIIGGRSKPETLILAGVAVSSFLGAVLAFLIYSSDRLQSIYFWMLGSLSYADWSSVMIAAFYAIIGISISILFRKELNTLLLGEEESLALGVDVNKIRMIMLAAASLMAGAAVSICGIIGFVGLIVPHIVRITISANYKYLILFSALLGAIVLVCADILARVILSPSEIPIGIVMAAIGAPFFIYLLRGKGINL